MIYNRAEFKKTCSPGEWLFVRRNEKENKCQCNWFIQIPTMSKNRWEWEAFDKWNWEHLTGECHSYFSESGQGTDWWGFTEETDISFWLLRWS